MLPVEQPFKTYTGLDGKPLDSGYVYFGKPNQNPITAPVTVYWDAAGTMPAAQPLRTVNGYIMRAGTPANVFFDGTYSELVQDSKKRQVFYARTSEEFSIAAVVSRLFSEGGAALIGFMRAGRTVFDKLMERPSVMDYGAKGDGVTDDSDAIIRAIAARKGKRLEFPAGTYRLTKPLLLDTGNTSWIFEPGAVLDFHLTDPSAFPITCTPGDYGAFTIDGMTLNAHYTGAGAFKITKGAPKLRNVTVNESVSDSFFFELDAARYDWIENLVMENCLANGSGNCLIHVYMKGIWNGTPFFNETFISQLEARGLGTKVAGANAIRFTFDGTDIAQVTGVTILQANLDAQQSGAAGPLSHAIYGKSINGGKGRLEGLFIKGGGWESTGGVAPAGLKNIEIDDGLTITNSNMFGIVNYNWCYGAGDRYTKEASNFYADAYGAYYPLALTKPDGAALKGLGGFISGFSNSPVAYRMRDFLVQAGPKNMDIYFIPMQDYEIPAPIYVNIFHKAYPDSMSTYGKAAYVVTPGRTNQNFVQWSVESSGSANPAFSFDPAAVTFSIVENGLLRVTIPGGASVGTGGAGTAFDISADRMGVGLPGIFPALPI